jgi:hypothetical protein
VGESLLPVPGVVIGSALPQAAHNVGDLGYNASCTVLRGIWRAPKVVLPAGAVGSCPVVCRLCMFPHFAP